MKKSTKRFIILGIVLVLVILALFLFLKPKSNSSAVVDLKDTTVLSLRDIKKSISGSGIVESADSTLVYSTLASLVESVDVKLGDYVVKGQLLAVLDSDSIQNQLTSAQISLNSAQTAQKQQLEAAQANYDNFVYALENGLNTTLNSAQAQADSAFEGYSKAKVAYNNYLKSNPAIVSAKANLDSAKTALESAKTAYENDRDNDSLRVTYENAQSNYTAAQNNYNAVLNSDSVLKEYERAAQTALKGYETALTALKSVKNSLNDQLEAYETALKNAKESSSTESLEENIRQLKVTLADTQIKAPVSGTVTAVYAKKGASGSGLLFVIEDTENLIVDTSVKSYDIASVKEGLLVSITSEAIKDKEFEGIITSVAPTADKTAYGTTDISKEAAFSVDVEVTSKDSGLKIGMEVDLDFIIEEQNSVFAVPYDAVYEKGNKSYVICAEETKDGKYRLKEIEVSVGLDDDFDIVISSANLSSGMRILNDTDGYTDLIGKVLPSGTVDKTPIFPFQVG